MDSIGFHCRLILRKSRSFQFIGFCHFPSVQLLCILQGSHKTRTASQIITKRRTAHRLTTDPRPGQESSILLRNEHLLVLRHNVSSNGPLVHPKLFLQKLSPANGKTLAFPTSQFWNIFTSSIVNLEQLQILVSVHQLLSSQRVRLCFIYNTQCTSNIDADFSLFFHLFLGTLDVTWECLKIKCITPNKWMDASSRTKNILLGPCMGIPYRTDFFVTSKTIDMYTAYI